MDTLACESDFVGTVVESPPGDELKIICDKRLRKRLDRDFVLPLVTSALNLCMDAF